MSGAPDAANRDPDRPLGHRPVMLAEVLAALAPKEGAIIVDATFGGGGYAAAILDRAACVVIGIDRDAAACARGEALAARHPGRLTLLHGRFGEMVALLQGIGITRADGVAFDLGVSSFQLDDAERGFSFRGDGPLDMRMDASSGCTAADLVNSLDEADLARILRDYGEERAAKRIARAVVRARVEAPIMSTGRLASVVHSVLPRHGDAIDPATRTFQALRIEVNDELGELQRGLRAAEAVLAEGGRLCVVAFHSLEDRIVKQFLRQRSGDLPRPSRHQPAAAATPPVRPPTFRLVHRRAQQPHPDEVAVNPRARSARLRVAERTAAPAWPDDFPSSSVRTRRAA
jgi:16S rRNA (cytosine1402-N4)-methyltransferase